MRGGVKVGFDVWRIRARISAARATIEAQTEITEINPSNQPGLRHDPRGRESDRN